MRKISIFMLTVGLFLSSTIAVIVKADAQTLNAERCSKKPKPADCK